MYHSHVHFYLVGLPCNVFDIVEDVEPLENFTHSFFKSCSVNHEFLSCSDIVIAHMENKSTIDQLEGLCSSKKKETQLIILTCKEKIDDFNDYLSDINDIWIMPMTDKEVRFRFLRWQQNFKMSKDYWQTSHYLDATINNIPSLIWYKDKNGVHEKVNDSFCKTVNKTKEQVEGRRHAYIWDVEEDDPACIASENEVMTNKKTYVSEETVKTGEGTKLLKTYKSPLYDLDGSIMGTVGVAIDVTQERIYEKELLKKTRVLENIFRSMDCGVFSHSLDGKRVININSKALDLLGYHSQEELIKDGFNLIATSVLDEDKPILRNAIKQLNEVGNSVNIEYRVLHRDGKILHILGNIKLLEENGELFYQRFLLDVTAQKLREKKNDRQQKELIQALSIDFNLVCYFDLDTYYGKVIRVLDRQSNQYDSLIPDQEELSLKQSMTDYINDYVYEEDKERLYNVFFTDMLREELKEKGIYHLIYRAYRDGIMSYYEMKAVCAGAWDNDNHGIVLGFRNVDEEVRKEMEQKNLLEEALLRANKANNAKSIFLSNMSHDIRTPMNAIVGFTSLALAHMDEKVKVEEYLKKIKSSSDHLLNLINDVLDMSYIESGKIDIEEKQCHLPNLINELHNIVQADILAKNLELQIDINVVNEDIYCDQLRLNQVLLNLLSNAIKYTEDGGKIWIIVKERPSLSEGCGNYQFFIKDNGIGMSEEFVEHIFEPFEREENTTMSGIQGTGLGMTITKNIVDMMDGNIQVKSKQGIGTEVEVIFNFHISTNEEVPVISNLENYRVLIIDEDLDSCKNISYLLQQLRMRSDYSISSEEALQLVHQAVNDHDQYRIYIINTQLSNGKYSELIQKIKEENNNIDTHIILVDHDEDDSLSTQVDAFCHKPISLSELSHCLQYIINKSNDKDDAMQFYKERILLVEDNELNREIAITILSDAGFDVETAYNGQIALEMLKASQPGYYKLVLMDIQMPVMNGHEATKAIRQLENKALASIPVIAMTANAFEEDKREALKCGMNGYIVKPISVDKLLSTLNEILKK